MPDLAELVRKASSIEHPTNLVALRALANESARRAIGVHASKKHRHDAMTKFIVASLAGMTSVWLMMKAPHWRDMQFVAACVTLLIAMYWAGQAYAQARRDAPRLRIRSGIRRTRRGAESAAARLRVEGLVLRV